MSYQIKTPCGAIQGEKGNNEGIIAYKGIRYAYANRFEYPTQVTSWDGIYDATKYKDCCYQPRSFYDEEKNEKKYFYYNEFRKGASYTYSEDCLFLNIWTPEKGENLPVIIYIHGGGYTGGCGHERHFMEPIWPLKGVIAVTINYRLGPLGFACIKNATDDQGRVGNYGLYDQMIAIKWIKDNIASFGGNPNNITIMGQSAGAMSVQQHCMSPLSSSLFQKAVMSSGGGVHKILSTQTKEKAFKFWDRVIELSNCKNFEEFKKLDVKLLFEAWQKANKELKIPAMTAAPVIDNHFIIGNGIDMLKEKKFATIPYMIGSTSEDMASPFMQSMSNKWCRNQKINSYCWMFNHKLPGDNNGAWHSSDLWYWFGTLSSCWRPMKKEDYDLSSYMVSYLTNFAKYGNPNDDTLPIWQNTTNKQRKVIHFNNKKPYMKKANMSKLWLNLFTKKSVGE